ncbi:hypothetical protein F5B21DRAFT_41057 [Xylaria acuta]|nr:hypothetical protein F5B21DRAFT_41057 [Xylaria acuta]
MPPPRLTYPWCAVLCCAELYLVPACHLLLLLPTNANIPTFVPTTHNLSLYFAPTTALSTLFPFSRSERPLLFTSRAWAPESRSLSLGACLRWVSRAYTRHITIPYLPYHTYDLPYLPNLSYLESHLTASRHYSTGFIVCLCCPSVLPYIGCLPACLYL